MIDNKTKEFLQKLKDPGHWNDNYDNYDYSKVDYVNSKTKVIVIDKKFGSEHLLSPNSLLNGNKLTSTNLKEGIYNFERARDFVRKLNIQSSNEWRTYSKTERPYFILGAPEKIYKNDRLIEIIRNYDEFLNKNNKETVVNSIDIEVITSVSISDLLVNKHNNKFNSTFINGNQNRGLA